MQILNESSVHTWGKMEVSQAPSLKETQPQTTAKSTDISNGNSQYPNKNENNHQRKRAHTQQNRGGRGSGSREDQQGRPRRRPNNTKGSNSKQKRPNAKTKPICSVCDKENASYKCPKCRAAYCSIACCRDHKENTCRPKDSTTHEEDSKDNLSKLAPIQKSKYLPSDLLLQDPSKMQQQRRSLLVEEDEDDLEEEGLKITQSMMDAMDKSEWLQNELRDGGLRQIAYNIINGGESLSQSNNGRITLQQQEEYLEMAKSKHLNFSSFTDKLLVITGILERQDEGDGDESLKEWLDGDGDDLGYLSLAPTVHQRQRELELLAEEQKTAQSRDAHASSSSSSSSNSSSSSEEESTSDDSSSNDDDDTT